MKKSQRIAQTIRNRLSQLESLRSSLQAHLDGGGKLPAHIAALTRSSTEGQLYHPPPDLEEDVRLFMAPSGQEMRVSPGWPSADTMTLRVRLIREEVEELEEALGRGSFVGTVDALVDILYVTVGALVAMGVPLRSAWNEVQRSNMSKVLDGAEGAYCIKDEGGKIMKPEGYSPPDLESILRGEGWQSRNSS